MSYEEENENFNLVMEETDTESVSTGEEFATPTTTESGRTSWLLVAEFTSNQGLKDYIQAYTHKVTDTHGQQKSKCNKHPDGHVQTYGYLRCSSLKCIKTPGDC